MATIQVFNAAGEAAGEFELDVEALAPTPNRQLLHDAVVMYQANRRLGSHKTKSRSEVSGSTRKLYRQKGTGNARAGSRRSGIRRGGGHIFALRPRDYSYRLPKKALRLATRMALRSRVEDGAVLLLESLQLEQPSTKTVAQLLDVLPDGGKTTLLVTPDYDPIVYRSGRNIEGVQVLPACELNAEVLLRPRRLVIVQAALEYMVQKSKGAVPAEA